jgi:hypothetical protein
MPDAKPLSQYFKRKGSPALFAKEIVHEDDPRVPMTSAEFLAKAWRSPTTRRESWAGLFERAAWVGAPRRASDYYQHDVRGH